MQHHIQDENGSTNEEQKVRQKTREKKEEEECIRQSHAPDPLKKVPYVGGREGQAAQSRCSGGGGVEQCNEPDVPDAGISPTYDEVSCLSLLRFL